MGGRIRSHFRYYYRRLVTVTIANTHQPDFKYTDSILKNWIAKGDTSILSDITKIDLVYQQEKEMKRRAAATRAAAPAPNRF